MPYLPDAIKKYESRIEDQTKNDNWYAKKTIGRYD